MPKLPKSSSFVRVHAIQIKPSQTLLQAAALIQPQVIFPDLYCCHNNQSQRRCMMRERIRLRRIPRELMMIRIISRWMERTKRWRTTRARTVDDDGTYFLSFYYLVWRRFVYSTHNSNQSTRFLLYFRFCLNVSYTFFFVNYGKLIKLYI